MSEEHEELQLKLKEQELKLKRLEKESRLAMRGLLLGKVSVTVIVVSLSLLIVVGGRLLSGWQFIALIAVVATAIILYFSFVFGRAVKVKYEISRTKQKIDIESGKNIRNC
ncbi:hypothetical protein ACFLV0_07260 [Chloroflexota bacterium]